MRLITRSDFDGLACGVLLHEVGIIDDYKFVHPKDVQDGLIEVTRNDVLTNIPYVEGCGLWFDHHTSESQRLEMDKLEFKGASYPAPSCARVIYEYYGGAEIFEKFDKSGLMEAVDKADAAQFTINEILAPEGWVLLSFIMDPRTGLGRYRDYRISNYALMMDMIQYCRSKTVDEILEIQDVRERVNRYFNQEPEYENMITQYSRVDGNVLSIDLRDVDEILTGNRFVEYAIFPEQNVSIRTIWGKDRQNVVMTVGHSIINRTCNTDVGRLMLQYGGGGHFGVGTCQVETEIAEQVGREIMAELKKNG